MKIAEQSVELLDYMGSDLSVVNAARVSFAKESNWDVEDPYGANEHSLKEADQKLIAYLARHNHWSPFAHAFLSFRIKAPIFVARQMVKHQVGLSWNEVSRRYVDEEPEFYMPDFWRQRAENVKQGSADTRAEEMYKRDNEGDPMFEGPTTDEWIRELFLPDALKLYTDMLKMGVAPEQARMVLPQNTMTEWVWSGSLMAFARVCKQRLDAHAQKETQEVAQLINKLVPKEFEYSWKALIDTAN